MYLIKVYCWTYILIVIMDYNKLYLFVLDIILDDSFKWTKYFKNKSIIYFVNIFPDNLVETI